MSIDRGNLLLVGDYCQVKLQAAESILNVVRYHTVLLPGDLQRDRILAAYDWR